MPQPIGILIHYRAEMSKIDAVLSIILCCVFLLYQVDKI